MSPSKCIKIPFILIMLISLSLPLKGCMTPDEADNAKGLCGVDESIIERTIYQQIELAVTSDPIKPGEISDPLDYFRPRIGSDGRVISRITGVDVIELQEGDAEINATLNVLFDQYYSDGNVGHKKDTWYLDIKAEDNMWVVSDIHIPV